MHNSCKDSFLVLCSVNYMRCQRLNQGKSHARQWPNLCTNSLVPIFVILNILILLSFTTLDLKIKTKTRNNYCLLYVFMTLPHNWHSFEGSSWCCVMKHVETDLEHTAYGQDSNLPTLPLITKPLHSFPSDCALH